MIDGAGTEQWRVTWFPPDKAKVQKILATEQAATSLYDEMAEAGHAPMMETRVLPEWEVTSNSVRDTLRAIASGARKHTPAAQPPLTVVEVRLEKVRCHGTETHRFGTWVSNTEPRRCVMCDQTAGMMLKAGQ